jgi:hypothetical protein
MKDQDKYDKYLEEEINCFVFVMSQRLNEVISSVQDLTEQINFWMREAECIKHELASYDLDLGDDLDLDEPDLNGKEEFYRAVEGGDTDGTLP